MLGMGIKIRTKKVLNDETVKTGLPLLILFEGARHECLQHHLYFLFVVSPHAIAASWILLSVIIYLFIYIINKRAEPYTIIKTLLLLLLLIFRERGFPRSWKRNARETFREKR